MQDGSPADEAADVKKIVDQLFAAYKQARAGQYDRALAELDRAYKAILDLRVYSRSPLSHDLKWSCEQIRLYWTMCKDLPKKEFPLRTPSDTPEKQLEAVRSVIAKIGKLEEARSRAVKSAEQTENQRKALAMTVGAVAKRLKSKEDEKELLAAVDHLETEKNNAVAERNTVARERKDLDETVHEVAKRLEVKPVRADILPAIDSLRMGTTRPETAEQLVQAGRQHLQMGRLDQARDLLAKGPVKGKVTPELLALRGEARWLAYLRQKRQARQAPSKSDAEVKQAIADLQKADTPEAVFLRGQIEELAGKAEDARKIYADGLKRFAEHKRIFQGAIDRLDTQTAEKETSLLPEQHERVRALLPGLLAALLTGVAPPPIEAKPAGNGLAQLERLTREVQAQFETAYRQAARDRDWKTARANLAALEKNLAELKQLYQLYRPRESTPEVLQRCFEQVRLYWIVCEKLAKRLPAVNAPFAKQSAAVTASLDEITAKEKTIEALAMRLKSKPKDLLAAVDQLETQRNAAVMERNSTLQELAKRLKVKPALADIVAEIERRLGPPQTAEQIVQAGREQLRCGHLEKAQKLLANDPIKGKTTTELLGLRGEARWLAYLSRKRQARQSLSKEDGEVKQAIADLQKADTPEANFLLGQIEELAGKPEEARKVYSGGLTRFPDHKRIFQSALDRLDTRPADVPVARLRRAPGSPLVALVTMFRPALPRDPDTAEAGFSFIEAVKLAEKHDYDGAIKALQQARTVHDRRRLTQPHLRPNPVSDPNDVIFLRCCDQLQAYWAMRRELHQRKYELQPVSRPAGEQVRALVAGLAQRQREREELEKARRAAEASLKAARARAEEFERAICDLARELKTQPNVPAIISAVNHLKGAASPQTWRTLIAVAAELDRACFLSSAGYDMVKAVRALIQSRKDALEGKSRAERALCDLRKKADGELALLRQARDTALEQKARALTEKERAEQSADSALRQKEQAEKETRLVSARLDQARQEARELNQTVSAVAGKLGAGESRPDLLRKIDWLHLGRRPEQVLSLWATLLRDPRHEAPAGDALEDAARILRQPADSAEAREVRGLALTVRGLALRNTQRYPEARKALEQALEAPRRPAGGDWQTVAQAALAEMSSLPAYYHRQARARFDAGQFRQALDLLDSALAQAPDDGKLRALRSRTLLALATTRSGNRLATDDDQVRQAAADAARAVADGAGAEGLYAQGQVAEALGQWARAESFYRDAHRKHPRRDEAGICYRAALARALLRQATLSRTVPSRAVLDEAFALVEACVRSGHGEGHVLRARVLALRGDWTEALRELARPGSAGKPLPAEYADELHYVVSHHPLFHRPAPVEEPDRLGADRCFNLGVAQYVARSYAEAEESLALAVRHHRDDARHWYYLGLAQLARGKPHLAADSFRQGARLEKRGLPQTADVVRSLERVQGEPRRVLNSYRKR